jgi:APA family basic amino acid/polyamine antiporter
MAGNQLFARKSIETLVREAEGDNRLHRVLGKMSLTSLGIGAIIGAGIFAMTGRVAAQDAGPAVVVSFIVAGLACAFAALCYAEIAAMVPVAGSAYTYSYATLGELFAWIIGWDLVLEYAMAGSTVASAWSGHFREFLDLISFGTIHIPDYLMTDPFTAAKSGGWALFNLPAVLIMVIVTAVLVIGIRESARFNNTLVLIKVGVVLFVIVVGIQYVDWSYWTSVPVSERLPSGDPAQKWGLLALLGLNDWLVPIDNSARSNFMPYGLSGMMLGAALVFFAYIGFDSISTHAEEARRPQRDVPFGILASLAICTVLYVAVAAIIVGLVPYPQISHDAAIASAFRNLAEQPGSGMWLRMAAILIATGALAGMTSVLLVTYLSQARIFLAMARDGLLPQKLFAAIHPKFRTPYRSTIVTGAVCAVAAAFTPIDALGEMVSIGTLMAFVMVCAAVLMLRKTRPEVARPFRCPAVWIVAPLGIAFNLGMCLFLQPVTWLRLLIWLGLGLAIYFLYGRRHSILGRSLQAELAQPGAPETGTRLDDMRDA